MRSVVELDDAYFSVKSRIGYFLLAKEFDPVLPVCQEFSIAEEGGEAREMCHGGSTRGFLLSLWESAINLSEARVSP